MVESVPSENRGGEVYSVYTQTRPECVFLFHTDSNLFMNKTFVYSLYSWRKNVCQTYVKNNVLSWIQCIAVTCSLAFLMRNVKRGRWAKFLILFGDRSHWELSLCVCVRALSGVFDAGGEAHGRQELSGEEPRSRWDSRLDVDRLFGQDGHIDAKPNDRVSSVVQRRDPRLGPQWRPVKYTSQLLLRHLAHGTNTSLKKRHLQPFPHHSGSAGVGNLFEISCSRMSCRHLFFFLIVLLFHMNCLRLTIRLLNDMLGYVMERQRTYTVKSVVFVRLVFCD